MITENAERKDFIRYIALEMREASKGSFPLSPGVMSGHYATANLYCYFRESILFSKSISDVFGKDNPEPLALLAPPGHRTISTDGLNRSVWASFLGTCFKIRPQINPYKEIETLISINAKAILTRECKVRSHK